MGDIIQFPSHKCSARPDASRVKALMRGEIDTYTCTTCGKDFEVINNIKPESCPHCKRKIEW